jgi:hypothetical protein
VSKSKPSPTINAYRKRVKRAKAKYEDRLREARVKPATAAGPQPPDDPGEKRG